MIINGMDKLEQVLEKEPWLYSQAADAVEISWYAQIAESGPTTMSYESMGVWLWCVNSAELDIYRRK